MAGYVDPHGFDGLPLILKRIGEDDFSVQIAGRRAGRILMRTVSGGRTNWFWTLTAPYLPAELQPGHGHAETLDEAKAAFRAKFDSWLSWARGLGHEVVWQG